MPAMRRRNFNRRAPVREPYDVVLLVCEGSKTEPNYLRDLRLAYRLSSVNIQILPSPGSDPLTIVNFAIEQMTRDADFNRGFCVFDRDQHTTFDAAIQRVQRSEPGRAGRLTAITSTPCFEFWLLLHYQYSTAAYTAVGGTSACERVIGDLRRHFADYAKGHQTVFVELSSLLQQALTHAARLQKHNGDTESTNPGTDMHDLINYLIRLKQ